MKQADLDWIASSGLGMVRESQQLKGPLAATGYHDPVLVLTNRGLFLVATRAGISGWHHQLRPDELKLEKKLMGDVLLWNNNRLSIPTGRSSKVQLLLAHFQVANGMTGAPLNKLENRYLGKPSTVAGYWLRAHLAPRETLLVWLETSTKTTVDSPILGKVKVPYTFFMTDRRAGLVAISEIGDGLMHVAVETTLVCEATRPYARLSFGGEVFQSGLGNAGLFRELSEMAGSGLPEIYRELARLHGMYAGKKARATVLELLRRAAQVGDPLSGFLAWSLDENQTDQNERDHWLRLLQRHFPNGLAWAEALTGWSFELELEWLLLEQALESDLVPPDWSLAFHRALHQRAVAAEKEPFRLAALDLALAAHLKRAAETNEARALLVERLNQLPSEQMAEVQNFAGPAGGRSFRARLLDLQLSLELPQSQAWRDCLDQLVMTNPLNAHYLMLKASDGGKDGDARYQRLADLLRRGHLRAETSATMDAAMFLPLTDQQGKEQLQHPLVRQGGVLAKVQQALAKAEAPDRGALRNFCERLNQDRFPILRRAVRDAALVLGLEGVEVYLSRGDQSIGTRGFEGSPPFLLLGGDHLNANSDYFLRPNELRFVVAAELAHIRFKHGRFRPADVWAGAWDKGRSGLDIVFSVVPLLKGVSLLSGFSKAVTAAQSGALGKVLGALGFAEAAVGKWNENTGGEARNPNTNLSLENETLVTTQRVLQLTADRAGLLLCGDPLAAIRAIFLDHSNLREGFRRLEDEGLGGLAHIQEVASPAFGDALQRVQALLAFYLSPDYALLRDEITRHEVEPA
ncbi:hypothetical protein [Acanthopleuribacter pedis]|uniref:Uncharacterized protein n=1 Tax=Acanthopleuribacter pedis TaxID=442870 RepID=A0A8J7QGV1_9BACT|nr:hypothetical protein [Acanthopleuribacter pedis]MBO1319910.1 hypothetical protein [Acanthopleuribacter pedis]